jgi:hypothetical protein
MYGGLEAIGLSGAEEAAYLLVIDVPQVTLSQLRPAWDRAEHLEEALEALCARGLVREIAGAYVAAPPAVALETLAMEQERRLRLAREYTARLASRYRDRKAGPLIEVVSGRQAMAQRLGQLSAGARREVRCLEQGADVRLLDLDRLPAGVTCRTIHDRAFLSCAGRAPGGRPGHRSRTLPDLPMSTLLVDAALAVLPLRVEALVVVHPCALLDALSELFENLWQRAIPAGDDQLIALLLSGLTDATIARRLVVGHRTVQRRVAALLAELGVNSRFQAGVQVAFREQ